MKVAPTKGFKGKDRRASAVTKIRLSPFRLTVTPKKGGFVCEFVGTDANGRKIEVELEFPQWWLNELLQKLDIFARIVRK